MRNNPQKKHIDIVALLDSLNSQSTKYLFNDSRVIEYDFEDRGVVEAELKKYGITYNAPGENEIRIDFSKLDFKVFYKKQDYLDNIDIKDFNEDIGIVSYDEDGFLFYDKFQKELMNNNGIVNGNYLIENTYYTLKFLDDFKSSEIASYHNTTHDEFILTSPENGTFLLGHAKKPSLFECKTALKNNYNAYKKRNHSKEFQFIFKDQIINALERKEKEERFSELLLNIKSILESTERNHEIYLNNSFFDKLKENFRKERDDYFSEIRDIINHLLNKIATLPISISTAVYAIYKVKSEPIYLSIVVIAFLIYAGFTCYLVGLIKHDTLELGHNLSEDVEAIIEKYPSSINEIKGESSKVKKKIKRLITTIKIFQYLLFLFFIIVFSIFIYQICWLPEASASIHSPVGSTCKTYCI